jgi:hypothetical protein
VGTSNIHKRNALHLAALHASTEVMKMLTSANLSFLKAISDAPDKEGHSPNVCFVRCRGAHCAVTRKEWDVEKRVWVRLMMFAKGESVAVDDEHDETEVRVEEDACKKRRDSFWDVIDEDEENGVMSRKIWDKSKESSFLVSETGCETDRMSEEGEEFVDAEDWKDTEGWLQDTIYEVSS